MAIEKSSFGIPCVTACGSEGVPTAVIVTVTAIGADCWPTAVLPGKVETDWAHNTLDHKTILDASAACNRERVGRTPKE